MKKNTWSTWESSSRDSRKLVWSSKDPNVTLWRQKFNTLDISYHSDGIQLLPEKLASMPAPWSAKEVKQFLGLVGYYCKFVPPVLWSFKTTHQAHKEGYIIQMDQECQACFKLLKEALCTHPILQYPDPDRPYVLFTDASKYGWARSTHSTLLRNWWVNPVDCLMWIHHRRGQWFISLSLILVDSSEEVSWIGLPLTKEAYATYMSVRKLSFYLTNADVLIRSDQSYCWRNS